MMQIKTFTTILLAGSLSAHGAITTISTSVPTSTDFFTDGGNDFFGIVETLTTATTGTLEGEGDFSTIDVNPPIGSLTGRDQDDGAGGTAGTLQALWELALPSDAAAGTGFTNIRFAATLAASQDAWDGVNFGANEADSITFELLVNGVVVATSGFDSDSETNLGSLRLDTNGDNIGDGLAISVSGTELPELTDAGGATAMSAQIRATYAADASGTTHWTTGTLSADYDMVPEPSSALLFGLGSLGLAFRRSRGTIKS